MQEGDVIKDWQPSISPRTNTRYLVGKRHTVFLVFNERCKWCDSVIHDVVCESKTTRIGIDGIVYTRTERIEGLYGTFCTQCGDWSNYYLDNH